MIEQQPNNNVSSLYDRADEIEALLPGIEQSAPEIIGKFKRLENDVNRLLKQQRNKPHDKKIEEALRVAMQKAIVLRTKHPEILKAYTSLITELASIQIELSRSNG